MTDPRLRQLLLAAQVIDEIDLEIGRHGIVLHTFDGPVPLDDETLLEALGGAAPVGERGRTRIVQWLTARAQLVGRSGANLLESARPIGLPGGHSLHPGDGFPLERVLGGCLDLGLGVLGLDPDRPDVVTPLPDSLWRVAGVDPRAAWPAAGQLLERMGGLAARRWALDPARLLRPMGDCDVVTLLGSAVLRKAMVAECGGMCPAIVPMRVRGWTRLSRLDPAFGPAAAAATPSRDRGFLRPLLVTASEVTQVRPGGSPISLALSDPVPAERARR
jgi:hypothetical protein